MCPNKGMNKTKKGFKSLTIQTIDNNIGMALNIPVLQKTIRFFKGKRLKVEDNTNRIYKVEGHITKDWNKEYQNGNNNEIRSHCSDLFKQANENYNTLRNTIFLGIFDKYKNTNESDFLTYDHLFKSIYDSYKLLNSYNSELRDTDTQHTANSDNKIRIHNMVMKLICGSKPKENTSSVIIPLSDNLNALMHYFKESGSFDETLNTINTNVQYDKRDKRPVVTLDEIDELSKEIDKENKLSTTQSLPIETYTISDEENSGERDIEIANDSRYLLFLKKTAPSLYKVCESTEEYIPRQREMLKEKGRINEARSKKMKVESISDLQLLDEIPSIPDVEWNAKDIKTFNSCVLKYKNNFNMIHNELPHIPMQDLIKKYYLSKDKTFSYVKKRSGRISDSEIKAIVEREWSKKEIDLFIEKYKTYGKNLSKYQTWINKSEKDLKLFLRYFLKKQKTMKNEVPQRLSISREDILKSWTIDERQIFAIYFPYFNKNWITMATYFPQKTSSELKMYYSKYFKGLSFNEQKFEASISNLKILFNSHPVVHVGDESQENLNLESAGIIFKR